MRLAVVSDIHGNRPALEAVIDDMTRRGADHMVNLGDALSGPLWPVETAERLIALDWPTIRGNHERQLLERPREQMSASDSFAAARLSAAQCDWIAALPTSMWLTDNLFCCHGTPASDLEYFLDTVTGGLGQAGSPGVRAATLDEATARAGAIRASLIVCGHTHQARCMTLADGRLLVNPGSVGLQAYGGEQPHPHRVEAGSPHARYAVVEQRRDGRWQVEQRQVPYDWESAAEHAERHGRGDWADALRSGRVGRLEADVLGQ